jgi:hypothetical protein
MKTLLAASLLLLWTPVRAAELEAVGDLKVKGSLSVDQGIQVTTQPDSTPVLFASSTTQPGNLGIGTANPAGMLQVGNGALTVTSGGMVGIGTTNPSAALEVAGTAKASLLDSASAPFIHIASIHCGGGCAGNHALSQWTDVGGLGLNWTTLANTSPATFSHNDHGRVTVLKAGSYMIRLHTFMQPTADHPYIAYVCPAVNGEANCTPNIHSMGIRHGYCKAGWWCQHAGPFDFVRNLSAGSTVGWAYYPVAAMNYWAYDYYLALEIVKIN